MSEAYKDLLAVLQSVKFAKPILVATTYKNGDAHLKFSAKSSKNSNGLDFTYVIEGCADLSKTIDVDIMNTALG